MPVGPLPYGVCRTQRRVDLAPSASKEALTSDFCGSVGASALQFRVCKTAVVVPGALGVDWPACFDSAPCRGEALVS